MYGSSRYEMSIHPFVYCIAQDIPLERHLDHHMVGGGANPLVFIGYRKFLLSHPPLYLYQLLTTYLPPHRMSNTQHQTMKSTHPLQ